MLNALSIQGMTELRDVARALADDDASSAIILKGTTVFSTRKSPTRPCMLWIFRTIISTWTRNWSS